MFRATASPVSTALISSIIFRYNASLGRIPGLKLAEDFGPLDFLRSFASGDEAWISKAVTCLPRGEA